MHTSTDSTTYNTHVARGEAYLKAHYEHPITLDEVVDYLHINKCYFCTTFKKFTGKTFSTYLNTLRIEKSQSLLLGTERSILEIALECGFSSPSYYTTTFKKIVGMTPQAFRSCNNNYYLLE